MTVLDGIYVPCHFQVLINQLPYVVCSTISTSKFVVVACVCIVSFFKLALNIFHIDPMRDLETISFVDVDDLVKVWYSTCNIVLDAPTPAPAMLLGLCNSQSVPLRC